MSYHITTRINGTMDATLDHVREELKESGFGVLTEIDIKETLKNKIGADFRPYRILGACNPKFAHEVLQMEDKVGVFLPCNVVVQEVSDGTFDISAVDPVTNMELVGKAELAPYAEQVKALLQDAVNRLTEKYG